MMRTKITVTTILGLFALTGCPADTGGTGTATDSNATEPDTESETNEEDSDEDSQSQSNSDPTTASEPTTDPTMTTDPDSSSTDPTDPTDPSTSEETGDNCTPDDACDADDDCAPGQTCVGCLCFGEPKGCADWADSGAWGNCIEEGNAACDGGGCLTASETEGVCFFTPCETPCDCPQPPAGFEEQVACENITAMGKENDCYISCEGGLDCPEGMGCLQGLICMFGVEEVKGLPPWSDCVNPDSAVCEGGVCLVDDPMDATWGACSPACMEDDDCPAPDSGESEPICLDISGEMDFFCILPCDANTACPDGMVCEMPPGICSWELVPPYGDCENNPEAEACLAPDTCIDTAEGGVCGSPCMDAGDCEPAPATGDAVVQCTDLGDGNICNLSCAMGETCPDGMSCFNDQYCHFTPA